MINSKSSFWERELFVKPCDLVIIGAGITGLSVALQYKKSYPDSNITILEKGLKPEGASTRNAGFACVGSISEHLNDLGISSEKVVRSRIKNRYEGLKLLRSTFRDDAIDYSHCEGFELFTSRQKFKEASKHIDRFNRWLEEATGERNVYSEGEMNGYPVIRNRLEGSINPGKLISVLIEELRKSNISVLWNCQVDTIKDDNSLQLVSGNRLTADNILIATNGFTPDLVPHTGIRPARGYVFVTNKLEDMAWKGVFHHDRGYIYFRNLDNRLLLGGARNVAVEEEETNQFGINHKIKNRLVTFASEVLQLPAGWKVASEWSGIMGFTETKSPVVQTLRENLYIAAGLSGMGIAIGMSVAKKAVELFSE